MGLQSAQGDTLMARDLADDLASNRFKHLEIALKRVLKLRNSARFSKTTIQLN